MEINWNHDNFLIYKKYKTADSRKIAVSKVSEIFVNKAAEPRWKRAMPDRVL